MTDRKRIAWVGEIDPEDPTLLVLNERHGMDVDVYRGAVPALDGLVENSLKGTAYDAIVLDPHLVLGVLGGDERIPGADVLNPFEMGLMFTSLVRRGNDGHNRTPIIVRTSYLPKDDPLARNAKARLIAVGATDYIDSLALETNLSLNCDCIAQYARGDFPKRVAWVSSNLENDDPLLVTLRDEHNLDVDLYDKAIPGLQALASKPYDVVVVDPAYLGLAHPENIDDVAGYDTMFDILLAKQTSSGFDFGLRTIQLLRQRNGPNNKVPILAATIHLMNVGCIEGVGITEYVNISEGQTPYPNVCEAIARYAR